MMRTKNSNLKPMAGELIVFEGPDGTGKTRLSSELVNFLRIRGKEVLHLAFPGTLPGSLGELVYQLHHDTAPFHIHHLENSALQCLHIAAHLDAIEQTIKPALKRGVTVILDRFWWSTAVYGAVGGVQRDLLDALIRVEHVAWGELKPAHVFLLERSSPLKNVPKGKWGKYKKEYQLLTLLESGQYPVHVIDNMTTVDKALHLIIDALSEEETKLNKLNQSQTSLALFPKCSDQTSASAMEAWAPLKPTAVLDTYWKFAFERQEVFFRRLEGCKPPWSSDPILNEHKFTNAYRAADRVSQYLIRNVIYNGDERPQEIVFRILLFKFFNKIETWELLCKHLGTPSWETFSFARYSDVLEAALAKGTRIYSAAYIMPTGGRGTTFLRKHHLHLRLLERMMNEGFHTSFLACRSMQDAFRLLKGYPSLGDFLAYQYATDLNYSDLVDFDEMEFVVPGPGAKDGIRKCFPDTGSHSDEEIIRMMADRQEQEFARLGLRFKKLWGRRLQLIDCQNLFCEVSKYSRVSHPEILGVSGRVRIKQKFSANLTPIDYVFPRKWKLDEKSRYS